MVHEIYTLKSFDKLLKEESEYMFILPLLFLCWNYPALILFILRQGLLKNLKPLFGDTNNI